MPYHLVCECGKLNITDEYFCGCTKCGRILAYLNETEGETMARPAHEDKPRKVTLSIPSSVMAQVELRLIDPLTLRAGYGSTSNLVTSLLKRWLEEQLRTVPVVVNEELTTTNTTQEAEK